MQFKDVIGQQAISQHLVEMVQNNRLSHALLFLGAEGAGALPLALAFGQYVVCEKAGGRKEEAAGASLFGEALPEPVLLSDACGTCPACVRAAQFAHPDIHFSFPVVPKKSGDKPISNDYITEWRTFIQNTPYGNAYDWLQSIGAENRQGNITAEECNKIIHDLSLKSFESGYKILIMWMPEYLSKEGNKLLKLIEEPPENTLFILVAENYEKILPTILSRCQLIKIPVIETDAITMALERENMAPEQASRAAVLSAGNFRTALQLAHNSGDENWQYTLREWLNAVLAGGPVAVAAWVDGISKVGREKQKQFLQYVNHLLAQSLRLRMLGNGYEMEHSEKDFAIRLNKMTSIGQQEAIVRQLDHAAYHIERNANPKLLFHALSIRLLHIIKENTLILTD